VSRAAPLLLALSALSGCAGDNEPDAYGNVEAIDIVVSAEATGRLEALSLAEGDRLASGAVVGVIDTLLLGEQRREVFSQSAAARSRLAESTSQIDVLRVQLEIAQRLHERTLRLHAQEAATAQQLDQAEREYRVLEKQIEAALAQKQTFSDQVSSAEARVAQIEEQISRATIRNPIEGTVLAKYAEAGELIQAGKPLYRVADLRELEVRAYVVQTQLASVRLGQDVRVWVDVERNKRTALPGRITWISSESEFTPTPIQTREERADLVYALKIRLQNPDGLLKIGMPVDVDFVEPPASP